MTSKAIQSRIAAMTDREREQAIEVVASVLEIVAQASGRAVEKKLRDNGLIDEPQVAVPSVYFIQGIRGGPIKIGYAQDPAKRLGEIQRTSPVDLTILATEPGDIRLERSLHERYSEWRLHGEWFSDDAAGLRLYIDQLRSLEREQEVTAL